MAKANSLHKICSIVKLALDMVWATLTTTERHSSAANPIEKILSGKCHKPVSHTDYTTRISLKFVIISRHDYSVSSTKASSG